MVLSPAIQKVLDEMAEWQEIMDCARKQDERKEVEQRNRTWLHGLYYRFVDSYGYPYD